MSIGMDRLRLEVEAADPRNRLTFGAPTAGISAEDVHSPPTWAGVNGGTITLVPSADPAYSRDVEIRRNGGTIGQLIATSGFYTAAPGEVWRSRMYHDTFLAGQIRIDYVAYNGSTSLGVVATYINDAVSKVVRFTTPPTTTRIQMQATALTTNVGVRLTRLYSYLSRGVNTLTDWTTSGGTLTVTDDLFVMTGTTISRYENCAPDQWASAALDVVTGPISARMYFYNGSTILTTGPVVTATAGNRLNIAPTMAPPGTTRTRLVVYTTGSFTNAALLVERSEFWAKRTGWTESTRPNNLLDNSGGELGSYGWVTPLTSSTLNAVTFAGHPALEFQYLAASRPIYFYSDAQPVTPGKWIGAAWRLSVWASYTQVIEFLDAGLNVISTSTKTLPLTSDDTTYSKPFQVPAGANYARLRFDFAYYNGELFTTASTPGFGGSPGRAPERLWDAVMAEGDTALQASGLPFIEATKWLDIIGPTFTIGIVRAELDVGTLNATISDPALDPATAPDVRPGKRMRVMARTPDDQWKPVYTGKIIKGASTYTPDGGLRTVLTATDGIKEAANVARPEGVGTINDLRAVLEGVGVPYIVNGSTDQIGDATLVAVNDNASALDQVVITRDTALGYAWVSRDNFLTVTDAAQMSTAPVGTFDESVYSKPAVDFNTDACINEVTVRYLRYNPVDQSTEEIVYGPYRNAASIAKWGRYAAEYTIQQATENSALIAAYAQAILTANGDPKVRINSITVPINTPADLTTARALVDLYDLARVKYAASGLDDLSRITGIQHTITPNQWLMTLDFGVDGAVAASQLTPSPSAPLLAESAQADKVGITFPGTNLTAPITVNFEVPYAAPPIVVATGSHPSVFAAITAVTATGFTIQLRLYTGTTSSTFTAYWQAMAAT